VIAFKPGVVIALRSDGSVRISDPGHMDTLHAAGTQEARDYAQAVRVSNLKARAR
jgi:hypothetical protein